jgi:hypothetical protein
MEPPTATMVISPAVSWCRRPDSGFEEGKAMRARIPISEAGAEWTGKRFEGQSPRLSQPSAVRLTAAGLGGRDWIFFCEIQFGQVGSGTGGDNTVTTCAFCLVKSLVGKFEEQIDAIGSFIEGCNPD